jgi:hypothetical protein
MGGVIIPEAFIDKIDRPIIYLIGPIRGAPNWQDEAVNLLLSEEPELLVVSPRRGVRDSISKHVLSGKDDCFPRQRTWERHYIKKAMEIGSLLIWLPGEKEHRCEKSYGAMTRFELGQIFTHNIYRPVSFVIGSDGKFSELDTIKYDLIQDAPSSYIVGSLEQTCFEAIKLAKINFLNSRR